jgi:NAD(P)-dependent dehydrogenase (short-subunit alcohol dehydrogenase family)
MASDPFDALRLTLMQDVLPVGAAVVERVRKGGAKEVLAAFDGSSPDPLGRLREEGEPTASIWRENLDRVQPGLGNPVMKVEVRDVDAPVPPVAPVDRGASMEADVSDPEALQAALARISERLALLERRLESGPAPDGDAPPA